MESCLLMWLFLSSQQHDISSKSYRIWQVPFPSLGGFSEIDGLSYWSKWSSSHLFCVMAQIHDGRSSRDHLHGRYCGTSLPGDNGTIITTHNVVYMWFRSDHSVAGNGFNFTWNATAPGACVVCSCLECNWILSCHPQFLSVHGFRLSLLCISVFCAACFIFHLLTIRFSVRMY